MVKFIGNARYITILMAVMLFTGTFTFFVMSVSLLYINIIGIFVLPPLFSGVMTAIVYSILRKAKIRGKRAAKYLIIVLAMFYILFESLFTMIIIHTIEMVVLLVPLDMVILSLPMYIKFNRGKSQPDVGEYSPDLTSRLSSLLGNASPEVYIKNGPLLRMGIATDGDPWKIIIYRHTVDRINDEEMEMVLLELYYRKMNNTGKKLLSISTGLFTALVDGFIISYIVAMNVSASYAFYVIGAQSSLFVLILLLPYILSRIIANQNSSIDRKILKINGNRMALISLIQKESNYEPPGTMTQFQYNRFKKRQTRNAERRIKNLDSTD